MTEEGGLRLNKSKEEEVNENVGIRDKCRTTYYIYTCHNSTLFGKRGAGLEFLKTEAAGKQSKK